MSTSGVAKRTAYLAVGAAGLVFAAAYLALSFQLPFGIVKRPGAAVFPVIVGVIVVLASLATLWEGWRMEPAVRIDLPAGADGRRVGALAALLLGYFLVLPWLGHVIAGALFIALAMRLLSTYSWPRLIAYAAVAESALYVVFVRLLQVPLPAGVLDF